VFNFSTAATAKLRGKAAEPTPEGYLGSSIHEWTTLPVKPTASGARRDIFDRPTATLKNLECHVTTIKAGESPHAAHRHPDEEIILIKEGQVTMTIAGQATQAGPGSIIYISANDEHGLKNTGTTAATYYVLRLRTELTAAN